MDLGVQLRGPPTSPHLRGAGPAKAAAKAAAIDALVAPHSAPELDLHRGEDDDGEPRSELLRRRKRGGLRDLTVGLPSPATGDKRSFQEWLADSFDVHSNIGQGTTSLVQHATRRSDGREVALKTMMSHDPEMVDFGRQEYEVLQRLHHPHLIQALDFLTYRGRVVVVLEFFDGLTLNELLKRKPAHRLSEGTTRRLAKALLSAVEHLHHCGVLHRDIKPENMLVTKDARDLRVIDFNTACCLSEGESLTPTGTRLYAAPEVVRGGSPSADSDVWGVGLCAYLMLSGHLPQSRGSCAYSHSKLAEAACQPVEFSHSAWESVSPQCKAVLRRCLSLNSRERLTPKDLLDMPWFHKSHQSRHEGSPAGPTQNIITDAFKKCPLLPGLEPSEQPLSPAARSVRSASTALPSSRWSAAPTPAELAEPAETYGLDGSSEQLAQDFLEPGSRVEIKQSLNRGIRPFELWPRLGMEAVIVMVNIKEKIYKVRFPDNSICCVPVEHTTQIFAHR